MFYLFIFKGKNKGSGYWQPAVTSESSLETAGCLIANFRWWQPAKIYGWYMDQKINNEVIYWFLFY